jgi:uncharacterized protein (TIGR03118 family)
MHCYSVSLGRSVLVTAGLTAALVACSDDDKSPTTPVLPTAYTEAKLVADATDQGATVVDANLVNPWGLAFSPNGILWASNNQTGTSTLYDAAGAKLALVVAVPSSGGAAAGAPTGIVFNPTPDFAIAGGGKALFIFSGEDGTITAWNQATGTNAQIVADRSADGAVYKGLALAADGGANFLYATDFKNNAVDVFDASFNYVKSFTDPAIPAGFAPFGIQAIGDKLYVTFAKQLGPDNEDDQPGVGNGYVDVFNTDGTLSKQFAAKGRLNSPWAVALAPATFGSAGGDILIGNFGDGLIGAYDATTGAFRGFLHDANSENIIINGLWALTFGVNDAASTLYFSAGPSDETHGLLGTLTAQTTR